MRTPRHACLPSLLCPIPGLGREEEAPELCSYCSFPSKQSDAPERETGGEGQLRETEAKQKTKQTNLTGSEAMVFPGTPPMNSDRQQLVSSTLSPSSKSETEKGCCVAPQQPHYPKPCFLRTPILSCKVANPKRSDSAFLFSANFLPGGRRGARSRGAPLSRWEAAWCGGKGRTVGDRSPRCRRDCSSVCNACMTLDPRLGPQTGIPWSQWTAACPDPNLPFAPHAHLARPARVPALA